MLAGGRVVLGVYYLLGNNYYCQSEGGEDSSLGGGGEDSPPFPPLENTLAIVVSPLFICQKIEY